ncbi:LysR family transcriptional regulator [Proteus mirabilis]|uniref:LysR family transcriptional regulator n=1 Tax=Proteus mirabilis TaxID=584 RepID=UPI003D15FC2F
MSVSCLAGYRSFPCSVHRRRRASEFSACGQGTGISQSSVSARVKALEDNLGVLLFERHARGVRLTDAGRHFMERVTAGVDQLDHAVKTAE